MARDDVAVTNTEFPQIMLVCESQLARNLRLSIQETSVTLSFDGREEDLPADFLELRNVFIDDNVRHTEYMTPQALRESAAWSSGRVGQFYTLEGNPTVPTDARTKMVLANEGSATAPTSVEVLYYARLPALVDDPDTNWLLVNHYDVYLYAALRAACEWIQEDILEDRYAGKLAAAIEEMSKYENRKRYGAVPKQSYADPRGVV